MKSFWYKLLGLLVCFLSLFNGTAQVGIGTLYPSTMMDVNGAISLREGPALVLNNNNNNNISLGAVPFSFYRIIGPTNSFDITGINAENAGDGQIVTLLNTTDEIMTISNQNNSSSGPNRIFCGKQSDIMVRGKYASVTLQYNANSKKWIAMSSTDPVETWYIPPTTLSANTAITYSVPFAGATKNSGFTVNLVGPAINNAMINSIIIEYKEARSNTLIFRVHNTSINFDYVNVQFVVNMYK